MTAVEQGNDYIGIGVATTLSEATDVWWAPVETVSNSEAGFERVYQGTGLLFSWPLSLAPGASRTVTVTPRRVDDARPRGGGDRAIDRHRGVDHRRGIERARESRPARRPRPLLPAVARRPVQRARSRRDPSAAPAHDWTARVSAECYRPNAERGNLRHDLVGPRADARRPGSETGDPVAYRGFVARRARASTRIAQPFHHTILPLASAADRRTEIRWGLRDFELRFGRPATAACGCPRRRSTCRRSGSLAEAGIRAHDPRAVAGGRAGTSTRAGRTASTLGGGRSIVVAFYDARAVRARSRSSRGPRPTRTGSREEGVEPRLASGTLPDDEPPLVVDRHRRRAVRPPPAIPRAVPRARSSSRERTAPTRGFDVVSLRGGPARAGRPPVPRRSRSSSARRGAATTASCAGAPSARARRTVAGRRRCARPSSGSRPRSTPSRPTSRARLPGIARPMGRARCLRGRRRSGHEPGEAFARRWLRRRSRHAVGRRPTRRRCSTCWRPSAGGWRCSPATAGTGTIPTRPETAIGPAGGGARGPPRRRSRRRGPGAPARRRPRPVHVTRSPGRRRDDLRPGAGRGRPAGAGTR